LVNVGFFGYHKSGCIKGQLHQTYTGVMVVLLNLIFF